MNAPYKVGDTLYLLHSSSDGGTVFGGVPVTRVVQLNDGRGLWRVEADRTGGGRLHLVVDQTGRDANGYVSKSPS